MASGPCFFCGEWTCACVSGGTTEGAPVSLLTDADHLCTVHRTCLLSDLLGQLDHADLSPESIVAMRRTVREWAKRCTDGLGHQ